MRIFKTIKDLEELLKEAYIGKSCRFLGITRDHRFVFDFERDEEKIEQAIEVIKGTQ